jgi:hypothetical protein
MEQYVNILREIEARPRATIGELRASLRAAEQKRRDAERQEMERFRLSKVSTMRRRVVNG